MENINQERIDKKIFYKIEEKEWEKINTITKIQLETSKGWGDICFWAYQGCNGAKDKDRFVNYCLLGSNVLEECYEVQGFKWKDLEIWRVLE